MDIQTRLVHAGEPDPRIEGAVAMPIFQSSTFVDAGTGHYHDVRYIRLNNTPNHRALCAKLAAICGGEAAMVMSSGMAAISTSLLALVGSGEHILAQDCLYGGTHSFLTQDAARLGVEVDFFDGRRPETWAAQLRPETKVIYAESITNPLVEVADLEAIAAFAKAHRLVAIIDNTFASPINYRPLEQGFDLSIHSATKYLNGHSDIVAGAVVGRRDLVDTVVHALNHLGGCLDPHACFLLQRGMKTLALRVRHQNRSALHLARRLEAHEAVTKVHYPGLEGHPDHSRAMGLMGGFGGVLSFEVEGGVAAADALLARLTLPINAPSLGGVETLITRPALTSHAGVPPEERARIGIGDGLIRVATGIEDLEDLWADFERALNAGR